MEKLAGARKRRFSVCRKDVIGYLFLLPELVIFTIFSSIRFCVALC